MSGSQEYFLKNEYEFYQQNMLRIYHFNPLTAGAAYIRVFTFY